MPRLGLSAWQWEQLQQVGNLEPPGLPPPPPSSPVIPVVACGQCSTAIFVQQLRVRQTVQGAHVAMMLHVTQVAQPGGS